MLTQKDFEDRYKHISNFELLEILGSPSKYQAVALEAAKAEYISRSLSETELATAREIIAEKLATKDKNREVRDALAEKVNNAGNTVYEMLNPISSNLPPVQKGISWMLVVFALLLIYDVAARFEYIQYLIQLPKTDFESLLANILPSIVLFLALMFFGMKRKAGWMLLIFFCTVSLSAALVAIIVTITETLSDSQAFEFIAGPSPFATILTLLFYVGSLFALTRSTMLNEFRISKNNKDTTFIISLVFSVFLCLLIFV